MLPDSPPEEKDKALVSPHEGPVEVSGDEALRSHIKHSTGAASSIAKREAAGRPVVLGERTISEPPASIAELMHIPNAEHDTSPIEPGDASATLEDDKKLQPQEQTPGSPEHVDDKENPPRLDKEDKDS